MTSYLILIRKANFSIFHNFIIIYNNVCNKIISAILQPQLNLMALVVTSVHIIFEMRFSESALSFHLSDLDE